MSSIRMQPKAHISTEEPYDDQPASTSGARYLLNVF